MNSVAGTFTYPPQNSNFQFDYSDNMVTSWVTNGSYPTNVVLTLWRWLLNGQSNWTISMTAYNLVSSNSLATIQFRYQWPIRKADEGSTFSASLIEVVSANGSKSVALDVGPSSDFLGQFNINYNSEDGSQQKYYSPLFSVIHRVGEISPETWNQQALSTISVSHARSTDTPNTSSTSTSVSTSTGTSIILNPSPHLATASTGISATTSATTSAPASTEAPKLYHQSPSSATVIGLSIGITLGIAAICLIGFLYWMKKKKPDRRRSDEMFQEPATLVSDGRTMGEMDGYQKRLELPVGRFDAELDGSHSIP